MVPCFFFKKSQGGFVPRHGIDQPHAFLEKYVFSLELLEDILIISFRSVLVL